MSFSYSYDELTELIRKDMDRIDDFREIPDDLITLKPDPSSWSTTEIIQHIKKFNNLYIQQIDNALEVSNPVRAQKDRFKPGFLFRQFIRFLNPPYKIKVKTVAPMYPEVLSVGDSKKHIERLTETNRYLFNKINDFKKQNLDLDRMKGKNPVINWVSMTLTDFILVLEAHQRRHFWQIEQTLLRLSGEKF